MPRRSGHDLGFTLVEVCITALLLSIVLGATMTALGSSRDASESALTTIEVEERVQHLLHRMVDDIRWAGRDGEDKNRNGTLDEGEDRNKNGRLDADWLLTPTSIRFNALTAEGFSLPVTYRWVQGTVERVSMKSVGGEELKLVMIRHVKKFSIKPKDSTLRIELAVGYPTKDGNVAYRESGISVTPRN